MRRRPAPVTFVLLLVALSGVSGILHALPVGPDSAANPARLPGQTLSPLPDASLPLPESTKNGAEVWAYLLSGEERNLKPTLPVTDLVYFSAEINAYGELVNVPDIRKVARFSGRVHLVIAEIGSYPLTHFCLDPAYPVRDSLVSAIVAAAAPYDGVQIDFEAIPVRDRDNFVEFLRILKAALPGKVLSVALPARVSASGDVLGYARIAAIVDRIIIMAYDEHWSTSDPGPVASIEWGLRVARYVQSQIPADRLVMGIPFYGRSWTDKRLARAWQHEGVSNILAARPGTPVARKDGVPWFTYDETVTVTVWYDDSASIAERLRAYERQGIRSVAFWRLGQEDPLVWQHLAATGGGSGHVSGRH